MGTTTSTPVEVHSDAQWLDALHAVAAAPDLHRLVLQPIVDLSRGVVAGYEALSRFSGPLEACPERWFAAAHRLGWSGELESLVLRRAVALRAALAPGRFLTVNLSPPVLREPALQQVLADAGDLTGLVLELTEHHPFHDLEGLAADLAPWREAGAAVALDDTGSGYAGLRQLALLRPELVKLDRALVAGIDRDPVKQALAQLLGSFADRLDAWLLAEGVERQEELDVFAGLGAPLAQGFLLGGPTDEPAELSVALACHLVGYADSRAGAPRLASLLEPVPAAVGAQEASRLLEVRGGDVAVELDGRGVPVGLVLTGRRSAPVSLVALAGETVSDVAARAVTRPADVRFDPVVCVDERGMLLGVVRLDRLVLSLAGAPAAQKEIVVKQFACGAVVPGCTAVFRAETEQGILEQVAGHARDEHGIAPPPPELVEQVRAQTVDV